MTPDQKLTLKRQLLQITQDKYREEVNQLAAERKELLQHGSQSRDDNENPLESSSEGFMSSEANIESLLRERTETLENLERLRFEVLHTEVQQGSVVITPLLSFFICANAGSITHEGRTYQRISRNAPIFEAMRGKKEGETFEFRDQKYKIEQLF